MKQSFLRGAMVLSTASLTTKILGLCIQVVFARELGAAGFGLFRAVNPLVYMVMTISTLALPTALAKVIAEAIALHDSLKVRRAMVLSRNIVMILSISLCIITAFLAPTITAKWLDPRAFLPLIVALMRVPVVCVSSVIYGYYMGIQDQTPPAIAWIVETVVRTAVTIPLIFWANQFGLVYGAVAVIVGTLLGELVGFLYMYRLYRVRDRHFSDFAVSETSAEPYGRTVRALAEISIPTTFKNILGLIAYAAEPIIVYMAFANVGVSKGVATTYYGSIGMAVQLLLLPTVISSSLSTVLVPAVSEASAMRNSSLISRRLYQIIRVTLMIGLPSTVLFFFMGHDLAVSLYRDSLAGALVMYIAPVCMFIYIREPLSGILQGLNKATLATVISLLSSMVRMAAIYYFVSKPGLGIFGVANATAISAIISTMLSFFAVNRFVPIKMDWVDISKMVMATAGFTWFIHELGSLLPSISPTARVSLAALVGGVLYLVLLVLLRVVRPDSLERVPWIGPSLSRILSVIPFVS